MTSLGIKSGTDWATFYMSHSPTHLQKLKNPMPIKFLEILIHLIKKGEELSASQPHLGKSPSLLKI